MRASVALRIVLAGGGPPSRVALRQLVEAWGWSVVGHADDLLGAARLARAWDADVVLVDGVAGGVDPQTEAGLVPGPGRPLLVRLLNHPSEFAAVESGLAVMKGVPRDHIRELILDALAGAEDGITRFSKETGVDAGIR